MSSDEDIWRRSEWPAGWDVVYVAQTTSTNDELRARLDDGRAAHRTVLATGHQTAGRGRLDRRWDAPPGQGLLVSIAYTEVPGPPVELTHRVGLALVSVVGSLVDDAQSCGLKWPNDVLLDGRKLAGILATRSAITGSVVVGLGVNVSWAPDGAASLGGVISPLELLAALLRAHDVLPGDVSSMYRDRLLTLNQRVRAQLPNGSEIVGRAVDVDGDGRLHILDECAVTHRLDAADVTHLRPAADA